MREQIKKKAITLLCLFSSVLLFEVIYPVNSTLHKLTFLLSLIGCLFLLSLFKRIQKPLLITLGAISLLMAILFICNLNYSKESVKQNYLLQLSSYKGTSYWWGGENQIGIDCSGLPRKSLINALLKESVTAFSSHALVDALNLWFYDSSAKAMKEEYLGRTKAIEDLETIKAISKSTLPGDMAITQNGIHVLVFIGDNAWVQADPIKGEVFTGNPNKEQSPWYDEPVTIVRWALFMNDL